MAAYPPPSTVSSASSPPPPSSYGANAAGSPLPPSSSGGASTTTAGGVGGGAPGVSGSPAVTSSTSPGSPYGSALPTVTMIPPPPIFDAGTGTVAARPSGPGAGGGGGGGGWGSLTGGASGGGGGGGGAFADLVSAAMIVNNIPISHNYMSPAQRLLAHRLHLRAEKREAAFAAAVAAQDLFFAAESESFHVDTTGYLSGNGSSSESSKTEFDAVEGDALLEDDEGNTCWYSKFFVDKPHTNYVGKHDLLGGEFALSLLSAQTGPTTWTYRVIFWTKHGNVLDCLTIEGQRRAANVKTVVTKLRPEWKKALKKLKLVDSDDIVRSLIMIETALSQKKIKIGVVYLKEGQRTEEEMFSNDGSNSPAYEQFLNLLGSRVELAGFTGFAGGLSTKGGDLTGKYSIYRNFRGFEIMFHVATMIPSDGTTQEIQRKRFVGNDVAYIVFEDGNVPYNPASIRSHFNFIVAAVRPGSEENTFRVGVAARNEVPRFGPKLPSTNLPRDSKFIDLLLTKIINGSRACIFKSPTFYHKLVSTLHELLAELYVVFTSKPSAASRGHLLRTQQPEGATQLAAKLTLVEPNVVVALESLMAPLPATISSLDVWAWHPNVDWFYVGTDQGVFLADGKDRPCIKWITLPNVLDVTVVDYAELLVARGGPTKCIHVFPLCTMSTSYERSGIIGTEKATAYRVFVMRDVLHIAVALDKVIFLYEYRAGFMGSSFEARANVINLPSPVSSLTVDPVTNALWLAAKDDFYVSNVSTCAPVEKIAREKDVTGAPVSSLLIGTHVALFYEHGGVRLDESRKHNGPLFQWFHRADRVSVAGGLLFVAADDTLEVRSLANGAILQSLAFPFNTLLPTSRPSSLFFVYGPSHLVTVKAASLVKTPFFDQLAAERARLMMYGGGCMGGLGGAVGGGGGYYGAGPGGGPAGGPGAGSYGSPSPGGIAGGGGGGYGSPPQGYGSPTGGGSTYGTPGSGGGGGGGGYYGSPAAYGGASVAGTPGAGRGGYTSPPPAGAGSVYSTPVGGGGSYYGAPSAQSPPGGGGFYGSPPPQQGGGGYYSGGGGQAGPSVPLTSGSGGGASSYYGSVGGAGPATPGAGVGSPPRPYGAGGVYG